MNWDKTSPPVPEAPSQPPPKGEEASPPDPSPKERGEKSPLLGRGLGEATPSPVGEGPGARASRFKHFLPKTLQYFCPQDQRHTTQDYFRLTTQTHTRPLLLPSPLAIAVPRFLFRIASVSGILLQKTSESRLECLRKSIVAIVRFSPHRPA